MAHDRKGQKFSFRGESGMGWALLACFGVLSLIILYYTHTSKAFSETRLVNDLQWLNAWSIALAIGFAVMFILRLPDSRRSPLLVLIFGLYGFGAVCLLFNGTPFSYNAHWGDQTFRQTMLGQFMESLIPNDYYYKDLPPFYPPLYYYLLSIWGRVFSVEAYKLMKVGNLLTYLLATGLLYCFWRKIVSRGKAALIAIATFLYGSLSPHLIFTAPHEFLANAFFVPWWLHYIERIGGKSRGWMFYACGGLIGGLIFMTYYYAFFIGGLLLMLRWLVSIFSSKRAQGKRFNVRNCVLMILSVAVFSAPYWLPLTVSILKFGVDAAQREWFKISYATLNFQFTEFTFPGIIYLLSVILLARKWYRIINRSLLLLLIGSVVFVAFGSILGSLGTPILYPKAREFAHVLAGAFAGLAFAPFLSIGKIRPGLRHAFPIIAAIVILVFLGGFTVFVTNNRMKAARVAAPAKWLSVEQEASLTGAVALSGEPRLHAFYPVFSFISYNEHYSHHASRFSSRYRFVNALSQLDDGYLFNVCLRHNVFDQVDYFMPVLREGEMRVIIGLSDYPHGRHDKILRFGEDLVSDTSAFKYESVRNLYRVLSPAPRSDASILAGLRGTVQDSLLYLSNIRMLRGNLNDAGAKLLDRYLHVDWDDWVSWGDTVNLSGRGDTVKLIAGDQIVIADSLYIIPVFEVKHSLSHDHAFIVETAQRNDEQELISKLKFLPSPPTSRWEKGDIVSVCWTVPIEAETTVRALTLVEAK